MLKIDERKILTDERKSDIKKSWTTFFCSGTYKEGQIIMLWNSGK